MPAKTFVISYTYVPQIAERRQPHRADHLAHLQRACDEGRLVLAGATADPVDGAILVVEAGSPGEVFGWVANDPYARAGLIHAVSVREVTVAVARR
jgi:uncharacterized protein YciI